MPGCARRPRSYCAHRAAERSAPDFFFRHEGLVVEIEGYAFHGTRAAHERDVLRFNELNGCADVRRVLRFTASEVFRAPDAVVFSIRSALADLGRG
jgi:very-short-patch-repair endonuclease